MVKDKVQFPIFENILFYFILIICMGVSVCGCVQMSADDVGGQAVVSHSTEVLGTKLVSSERAVHAFNC